MAAQDSDEDKTSFSLKCEDGRLLVFDAKGVKIEDNKFSILISGVRV